MSEDPVVASLDDCLVRKSDVELLDGPLWLNDRLIGFYFEHIQQSSFGGGNDSKVAFLSPEVSQFLKFVSDDEVEAFVGPLDLQAKEVIATAINNESDPSRPGGSHWSLLIYSSQSRKFFHLDSNQGMNETHARATAQKIHRFLKKKERDAGLDLFFDFLYTEVPVSQQTNGYDCGMHVLYNAETSLRHFLIYGGTEGMSGIEKLESDGVIKELRPKVKATILGYKPS